MFPVSLKMFLCPNCRKFGDGSLKTARKTVPNISKWKYKLDDTVESTLHNNTLKPRGHPGIVKPKTIIIPPLFIKAVMNTLEDQNHPVAQVLENSPAFVRYLEKKKPPLERDELRDTVTKLRKQVVERLQQSRTDLLKDKAVVKSQTNDQLKKTVYNWLPVKYDLFNSLLYLVGKSAANYAVLLKIFSEIKLRDPNWKPRTLFDFGSGVGTVTWAANSLWQKHIIEYFNVDASVEMNELSEHLLKGGRAEKQTSLRGLYYRQFLPATSIPYDLVVSAYTLMELPSLQARLDTIKTLWNKTTKYLVVVEQGSNAGYKIINEVRDFVLGLKNGHVFSPCPHDDVCPRFLLDDGTPCNFEIRYYNIPISGVSTIHKERYSYIVLQKGERDEKEPQWPRLVRPTLLRHKHCVCNLCTMEGKIEQAVFTASKYGTLGYRCAKASDWGDRLPMNFKEEYQNSKDCELEENDKEENIGT